MMMLMSYFNETVAGDAGTAERNTWEPHVSVKSWREKNPRQLSGIYLLFFPPPSGGWEAAVARDLLM